MSFFYDLNKKLDSIRATPEVTHKQLNERDMSRAAKGYEKYGKEGMEALAKAGREGKALDPVRKKYDKYDNEQVSEESGEIPVGVIDGPGGYEGAQQRIKDYQSGKINKHGRQLPPVDDRSRPADKPTVYNKSDSEEYSSPPEWKGKYVPPVVDRSRSATDESGGPSAAKPTKPASQAPAKPSKPAPKGEFMGTIKGGVWTADPPKPGERGVPAPSGDPEGVREAGAPMTAKQKSFAKLAPPANKITFADKIAGAKKEVDEMLGDVAAEAMRSALGGGRGRNAAMDEDNAFDYKKPRSMNKGERKPSSTGGEIHQKDDNTVVHTAGRNYGGGDEPDPAKEKQSRSGAPKKSNSPRQERVTANSRKQDRTAHGQEGFKKAKGIGESDVDVTDQGEYDQEGDMAKDDIKTIVRHAQALSRVLGDDDNLPEWVQSKLAKIEGMMISIDEYMQNQAGEDDEEPIAEKAVSKQQQKFMGMAHAMQKGEKIKGASKELKKVAKTMKPKDTEDFAKTKHKGLPKKVSKNKEEVDENSEEGRLTTTRTGPGQTLTTSSTGRVSATIGNGKMSVKPGKPDKQMDDDTDTASSSTKDTSSTKTNSMVGKGIYDSMNRELELMIAESMSINMSDSTEGNKSLTITATDEDALKLGMLLKNAGLGGGDMHSHGEEACDTCGMPDCGCGDVQEAVDENAPDWPTNTEQADNNFGYAGGLNKPKADVAGTGQTTVPNTNVHTQEEDALRRMMEQAGIKIKNDLGPTSPEIARMSKAEVNAALKSGMSPKVAAMSKDEVNAALKSGMRPDTSNMNPDGVYGGSGSSNDPPQYEDSIQRMREMAGIKETKLADKDYDGDGTIESGKDEHAGSVDKAIKKAQAEKKVDESIFALTNQWKAYKG
jgi:hypothetical protein